MYLTFFGFSSHPFATARIPAEVFPASGHREALATLLYGVLTRKPFIALTGETGTGKTTLLGIALSLLGERRLHVLRLPDPLMEPAQLIRWLGAQLGVWGAGDLLPGDLWRIHDALQRCSADGRRIVIAVDEAQALPRGSLEILRLLSNFETGLDGRQQTILVGQPELLHTLQASDQRSLSQRIAIQAVLRSLGQRDAAAYVDFQLRRAGRHPQDVLTPQALRLILFHARGIPRRINTIADNALITAFGANARKVAAAHVREALDALHDRGGWPHWKPHNAVLTAAGAWCCCCWHLTAVTGWQLWWA